MSRLVKELVSEKTDWIPSSLLQPAEGDASNIHRTSRAGTLNRPIQQYFESVVVSPFFKLLFSPVVESSSAPLHPPFLCEEEVLKTRGLL